MSLHYHEARSIPDAVALMASLGPDARMIAGGTDLIIQMRRKQRAPGHLVNIQPIEALQGLAVNEDGVRIGALATHKMIDQKFAGDKRLHGLSESARVIGGHQVRNAGTIGGNLCNASPAADLLPILLVLEAEVHLFGAGGPRQQSLREFLVAPGRTTRADDEILTEVSFRQPASSAATAFLKAGRRRAMEISLVSVAAMISCDREGKCNDVRIAIGAAAPTAFRACAAEALLKGRSTDAELFAAAGQAAAKESSPISDHRASSGYRRQLVAVLTKRALALCSQRACA